MERLTPDVGMCFMCITTLTAPQPGSIPTSIRPILRHWSETRTEALSPVAQENMKTITPSIVTTCMLGAVAIVPYRLCARSLGHTCPNHVRVGRMPR